MAPSGPRASPPTPAETETVLVPHRVTLWHCGVNPTDLAGRTWIADPPPFDETNAPAGFIGQGTMTLVEPDVARFRDASGTTIDFRPRPEGWEPPPCD